MDVLAVFMGLFILFGMIFGFMGGYAAGRREERLKQHLKESRALSETYPSVSALLGQPEAPTSIYCVCDHKVNSHVKHGRERCSATVSYKGKLHPCACKFFVPQPSKAQ
jgi:hypothetical protein